MRLIGRRTQRIMAVCLAAATLTACAYLATPYARRITGTTTYVDGGVNIVA